MAEERPEPKTCVVRIWYIVETGEIVGPPFAEWRSSTYRGGMGRIHESLQDLRSELDQLLGQGMAEDPIQHARQVAEIAGILHSAFEPEGFEVTMVGGSAIEVHAPGIYRSGDLDLVIERASGKEARRDEIFKALGFEHWKHTAYGEQAIDMLAAFEGDLDMSWLGPELRREDAFDALEELRKLASSNEPVTDQVLRAMIDELHRRP
jgi:hypothetical protein